MFDYLYGGAGSRKTSRLCEKALEFLKLSGSKPRALALTTYAREAANQLLDRLRVLVLRDDSLTWSRKLDLVNGLDAATIGTNHALGRAAMDQHWLDLGKAPSPEVIDEAARREFVMIAIEAAGISAAQQKRLDRLSVRLTRPQPHRDVRALMDIISNLGIASSALPPACMTSVDVLCNELDQLRQTRGLKATEATFRAQAVQAAGQLQAHPKRDTGDTRKAREAIEAYIAEPTWARLHKLTTVVALAKATKKEPITPDASTVAPLRRAAADYHLFPEFVADLREYVEIVSSIAADAHQQYRRLVAEANRVDFSDMEQALHDLLADPVRRKAFCAPWGFIGSDESQDMTARSAAAIGAVTRQVGAGAWLADPNQSIYPFRGADHVAVDNEANNLLTAVAGGASPTTHYDNHRSPPGIIRFVNDLFYSLKSTVLAGGAAAAGLRHLPADHIQTAPVPPAGAPPASVGKVERWLLSETSQPKRFAQLADGVARILARDTQPGGKRIEPEDICIMVRDRYAKKDVARALRDRGIKVAMRSSGLFDGREVTVILNAARLLFDRTDSIAEASLWFLLEGRHQPNSQAPSLDSWLVDRIAKTATTPKPVWLEAIENARAAGAMTLLSPLSSVILAIEVTGILGRIAVWGDSFERQARIDSLLALAANFTKQAKSAGRAATVGGFLAMCEDRAAKEAQAYTGTRPGGRSDAEDGFDAEVPPKDLPGVRLMTNHATKGLGFPITIIADFSLPSRAFTPFEITTLSGMPHVWPDPLAGEENTALVAIARGLAEGRARYEKQVDAETQLIYVSFSRSQGELIVAPADDPEDADWLPAVFGPSNPAAGAPAGIDHFLPTNATATQVVHTQPFAPLPSGAASLPAADYTFVNNLTATVPAVGPATQPAAPVNAIIASAPRPLTSVAHPPRYRSPSDNRTAAGPWQVASTYVSVPEQNDLINGRFKAVAAAKADALGEAFHAFMAAIPSLPPLADGDQAKQAQSRRLWEKVAARCLGKFLNPADVANIASAGLSPAAMVDRGQAFVDWSQREFGVAPSDWIVETGVSGPANAAIGGTWRGRIDLAFVARSGALAGRRVLVDHKAVMAARPDCVAKAGEYVGEVSAYAESLATVTPVGAGPGQSLAPDAIYIHFPLAAAIVPLLNAGHADEKNTATAGGEAA
jgi:superfamily I DNA/RNA helicase